MSEIILHTTYDGHSQIKLRADPGMVWVAQLEMAKLFQTTEQNIAMHLKAIFSEQELGPGSVVNQRLTSSADGKSHWVAHRAVSHAQIKSSTHSLNLDFDQRRRPTQPAQRMCETKPSRKRLGTLKKSGRNHE